MLHHVSCPRKHLLYLHNQHAWIFWWNWIYAKKTCFWATAHAQKPVFDPKLAHMMVWVIWDMLYRVSRHRKPLSTYPTCLYSNKIENIRKIHMFLGHRISPKTSFWPKSGTHDGLSGLRHALSCSSSSKTFIYIPKMPIFWWNWKYVKNSYVFGPPRMHKNQFLA